MKRMLLGLLLMPCAAHTMQPVERHENDAFISFSRGSMRVQYNKTSHSCISITKRDGGCDLIIGDNARDIFMELEQAYFNQTLNR